MYPISQLYDQYLKERARQWAVKLDIAGTEYGMDSLIDFSIENNLTSADDFEIGTAIPSKLVLRLKTTDEIPPNARIVPYIALNLPEEYEGNAGVAWQDNEDTWATADYLWNGAITEWLPLGEFFVDKRERINDVWEFVCYDRLVFADVAYVSQLSYPATMQAVWDEICTHLGFTYDSSVVIGSYTLPVAPTGYSCRQVMAYIAGANGASVYVGKDGLIKFRRYASSDTPVVELTDADYITVKETGPAKTYTKVVVVYDTDEGLAYEAGSGDENHTLYVECPFGTQQIANALLVQLQGFTFVPIQMDARGYPQIEVGDRLRYGRPAPELTWNTADVAWQDADFSWDSYYDGAQSLALNMTFGFKGGLSLQIDAPAKSEQESEFGVDGSLTTAINRLNRNAVKKGKPIYGVTFADDRGFEVERSDHKSKITLNSDVQRWEVDGIPKLEYDALANKLKFTGDIIMEGGSISWSNVNAPDIDDIPNLSGRLTYIGPTGIYSGTIKTDQLIAGSAKISSALIDTIKANQIVVGDNGEKIGDGLISSAPTWNGKTTLLTPTGIYTGTVRATQIIVGEAGEKIGDNLIDSAANWNGKTTLLTPTGIYTGTIEADQINATSLSAISANLGTITAGTIQGVTILGGIISGVNMSGATVTGGLIQTKMGGAYPRIELSENNNWLNFESSPTRYFRIYPVSGFFSVDMLYDGSAFSIGKGPGSTTILTNDNLVLTNGSSFIQMIGNAIHIHAEGGVFIDGRPI
jgi:hypothetical protein